MPTNINIRQILTDYNINQNFDGVKTFKDNLVLGTITINPGGGQIQALNGNLVATTTIGLHSATGGGVDIQFWSNGTNWYR